MKKTLILTLFFCIVSLSTLMGQSANKNLNYQAVILDPKPIDIPGASLNGQPLSNGKVCLKFTFLNSQGIVDYEEIQQATTDEYGLINLYVGQGTYSAGTCKSFQCIIWDENMKSMRVSVSYDGCNSFKQVSTQMLNYTPYALYAEAVDYKNVRDTPTKLSQFSNDVGYLIPKDLNPLQADIQTNTANIKSNTAEIIANTSDIKANTSDIKANTIDIKINAAQIIDANKNLNDYKKTSDDSFKIVNENIAGLEVRLDSNSNSIMNIEGKLIAQQNQIENNRDQITSKTTLLTSQISDANNQIETNKNISDNSFLIVNQSISEISIKVDSISNSIVSINGKLTDQQNQINDNRYQISTTTNTLGRQMGDIWYRVNTTASSLSTLASDVEVLANKSTSTTLGGDNPSDQLYPSQKAAKAYVDNAIYTAVGDGVADATTLAPGKVQLSGDLGGTAFSPTVPALANKENLSNKSTSTSLGTSNDFYPTQNAVKVYVDQATQGIALQATVDSKADKNSPVFTGNPILPTGTIAVTQNESDNSTKIATTAFVQQATSAGIIDASSITKGKIKLSGDLGGTADSPTVPGLAAKANISDVNTSLSSKEDVSNKSTATALGTSDVFYPSQKAVKIYVDSQIASATIADADASTKGKIQLAGDLAGTAASPTVPGLAAKANSADVNSALAAKADTSSVNSALALKAPLASPTFTGTPTLPIGTTAVTQSAGDNSTKLATTFYVDRSVAAATPDATNTTLGKIRLSGDLAGTADAPTVPALSLKADTSSVNTALALKANTSDVSIWLAAKADTSSVNSALALKANSTDVNISLAAKADTNSVNSALALKAPLASPTFTGSPSLPTGTTAVTQSAGDNSTKLATTFYVDRSVAAATPDATNTTLGKIRLSGDLAGTADAPTVPALSLKADTSSVNTALALKANASDVSNSLAAKADTSSVNTALALKANATDVSSSLAAKADTSSVNTALALKANSTDVTNALAAKADTSSVNTALALKANASDVSNSLAAKADTSSVNTALALKANASDVSISLAAKADTSSVNTALALKASSTYVSNSLAAKADTSSVNTALALKANTSDVSISLAAKADTSSVNSALTLKAPLASPTFTGTPTLPTGTTAVTQSAGDNSTKLATTFYVDRSVAAATPDATNSSLGKIQLAGDLAGTAASPTVPGLASKADTSSVNTALALKANATDVSNSLAAKADTSSVNSALALKANSTDVSSSLAAKADTSSVNSALALKANSTDVSSSLAAKADTSSVNSALTLKAPLASPTFTGTPTLPTGTTAVTQSAGDNSTKLATTFYVDRSVAAGAPDATNSSLGKIQLAGDLAGTAASPTVPGLAAKADTSSVNTALALKANTSDVSSSLAAKADISSVNTALALKASLASPTFTGTPTLPTGTTAVTQSAGDNSTKLATTFYVDRSVAAATPDATNTTLGKIRLSGDLAGTADAPTVPALSLKADTSSVNTALALKANASDVSNSLAAKADTSSVNTALALKANASDVSNSLAAKADTSSVNTALALKANTSDVSNSLAVKADTSSVNSALALKANSTDVSSSLAAKADTSSVNTALALKANSSDVSSSLAAKADTSSVNTALALKANSTDLTNYVTTNTAQTITASKTFSETTTFSKDAIVNGLTVGKGGGNKEFNTAIGVNALPVNTTGNTNTATGVYALYKNTTGSSNTASGTTALFNNTTGLENSAFGQGSLFNNTTGSYNAAYGRSSLFNNSTGSYNTVLGHSTLLSNTTGSNNTAIGYGANVASGTLTNATAIGNGAIVSASNTIQLGNTNVTDVKTSGTLTAGTVTYPNAHNNESGQVLTINAAGTASWAAAGMTDATNTTLGKIRLSGDLAGTADAPTVPALSLKADTSSVNTALALKANATDVTISLAAKADTSSVNTAIALKANSTDVTNALAAKADTSTVNSALTLKANATDVSNSLAAKADTSSVNTALALKANATDVTISLAAKADTSSVNTALALKANSTDVTISLAAKADTSSVITALALKANTSDVTISLAAKADTSSVNSAIALKANSTDVTISLAAKADTSSVNTAIALKANSSDVSISLAAKADTSSVNTALALKANATDLTNYVTTNTAQTITSAKTFSDTTTFSKDALINGITVGKGGGNGSTNTAIGFKALFSNQTGSMNTAIGNNAGSSFIGYDEDGNDFDANNTTSDFSVYLGSNTKASADDAQNEVVIGYNAIGAGSNTIQLGNTAITDVKTSGNLTVNEITVGRGGGNRYFNTALGNSALLSNTTGDYNTASGHSSLASNTTGGNNTAIGYYALAYNIEGRNNIAIGLSALQSNTEGSGNTAIGNYTNVRFDSLTNATAIGYGAVVNADHTIQLGADGTTSDVNGYIPAVTDVKTSGTLTAGTVTYPNTHNSTSGQVLTIDNAGLATWAAAAGGVPYSGATQAVNLGGYDLTVNGITVGRGGGSDTINTVIGKNALVNNTTGSGNTANGWSALSNNTDGNGNTAIGGASLYSNTTGNYNIAIGAEALSLNTTGSSNTAIGGGALITNNTGEFNTAIGYGANVEYDSLTNATAIGNGALVLASNTIQLGNTDVTDVKTSGAITAGGKIIAGASSASSTSAVMEANSTTQGFLPPRLTTTQRDSITTPVEGLTVWNTTNKQLEVYDGSYWRNMLGLLVSKIKVGDTYGGGKVFYIFDIGDNGYVKGQTHGLIAATEDQTTDAGVKWFPEKYYGATGNFIGLGLPNTLSIILSAVLTGTTNLKSFAAGLANSYRGGGYMDWYLPSRDELNLLYQNKDAVGGFATTGYPTYWSSSQKGTFNFTKFEDFAKGVTAARTQFFFTTTGADGKAAGTQSDLGIDNPRRVRAIRIF